MSSRILTVKKDILGANKEQAESNRKLLKDHHILMINIMSAPGSGKTSLILQSIHRLRDQYRIAVIEGDIASSIDAGRVAQQNIPTAQIHTGGGCHLDAQMIRKALDSLDLSALDLIFIENLGNLVCTADFDLGAHRNVIILSIPEGDDKARKYPMAFMEADAILLSKTDVLPYFDFKMDAFAETMSSRHPKARIMPLSTKTGEGLDDWFSWLEESFHQVQ